MVMIGVLKIKDIKNSIKKEPSQNRLGFYYSTNSR